MRKKFAKAESAERKHFFIDSGYIAIGRNFENNSGDVRAENHALASEHIAELIHAHTLLVGLVGSMLEENAGKPVPKEVERETKIHSRRDIHPRDSSLRTSDS